MCVCVFFCFFCFLQCGADYVKTSQKAPTEMKFSEEDRCVSFDGDADRIVYFFKEGQSKVHMHTHMHTHTHMYISILFH